MQVRVFANCSKNQLKFSSASSNPVGCLARPNTGDFARKKSPTDAEIQELWNAQLAKSPHRRGSRWQEHYAKETKLGGSAKNKEQREGVKRAKDSFPLHPLSLLAHPLPTSPNFFAHPRRAPSLARVRSPPGKWNESAATQAKNIIFSSL